MATIDDFITTVPRYRTEDGQEFATLAEARTYALKLITGRFEGRLLQALNLAEQLEAGDVTLAQFNANRVALAALLRLLVKRIRTGNE